MLIKLEIEEDFEYRFTQNRYIKRSYRTFSYTFNFGKFQCAFKLLSKLYKNITVINLKLRICAVHS